TLVIMHQSASTLDCGSPAAAFFCATLKFTKPRFFPQHQRFARRRMISAKRQHVWPHSQKLSLKL
ncbi:MAG: hypothetical protein N3D11_10200, partial [Candidatus Sumerlaeia bacterium]|nr:hypothetical protein [Candidatus Sumerlaeia bacterium]